MKSQKTKTIICWSAWIILAAASVYISFKALDYRRHVNYFLDKYTNVVSEFSGRHRYAKENAGLNSSGENSNRIVFLGDQIFESWNLEQEFSGIEAINRGVTGQWLAGFILRLKPDVIELGPRAVIIQFSSYNFRPQGTIEEIQDYVAELAELCRYHGIEPILTTVIPVREKNNVYKGDSFEPYVVSDSLAKFNIWLRDFCNQNDYLLADFNRALSDNKGYLPKEVSIDNTHLNSEGHKRLKAPIIEVLGRIRSGHKLESMRGSIGAQEVR